MRRLVAKYLGRHTPGRVSRAERAAVLREASLDELVAIGTCECGQPLSTHPPIAHPGPLCSWASARALDADKSRNGQLGTTQYPTWHL